MVTISYGWGNRLGNMMLMYAAAYVFAKKHNFYFDTQQLMPSFPISPEKPEPVTTGFNTETASIKPIVLNTTRNFALPVIPVHDLNFLELLNAKDVNDAQYHFQDYFQLKDFVLPYRQHLREIFYINYNPRPEKEIFVIVRLGDVAARRQRLPLQFYVDAIERLYQSGCYGGYITSDSPQHPDVQSLIEKYNLKLYTSDVPIETLNFGKDFNNLVLSEGTYCWWLGLLSNATNVFCNNRRKDFTWHGDIFVYPEWKFLNYDNPELPIDPTFRLW